MLSDACSDFQEAIKRAVSNFEERCHHYSSPPFDYGEEIEALKKLCDDVLYSTPERIGTLVRLADLVQLHYDLPSREEDKQMKKLVDSVLHETATVATKQLGIFDVNDR
jgi:hypothetical protein